MGSDLFVGSIGVEGLEASLPLHFARLGLNVDLQRLFEGDEVEATLCFLNGASLMEFLEHVGAVEGYPDRRRRRGMLTALRRLLLLSGAIHGSRTCRVGRIRSGFHSISRLPACSRTIRRYLWEAPRLLDQNKQLKRIERGRWKVVRYDECCHDGVHFAFRRHRAFLDDDGKSWDYDEAINLSRPGNDPWRSQGEDDISRQDAGLKIWNELQENNKASFEEIIVLSYENILAIDEDGDDQFGGPHIYTPTFEAGNLEPFRPYVFRTFVTNTGRRLSELDEKNRVKKFPREGDPISPSPPHEPMSIPDD